MKLQEIRNKKGILSGILIPADDIKKLQQSLKVDSELFEYFNQLQFDHQESEQTSTIDKVNKNTTKRTLEIHEEAFSKGVPMFYRDERAKAPKEFIRANPDGSEDLVEYDIATRSYAVVKPLLPAGKGYWSNVSHR